MIFLQTQEKKIPSQDHPERGAIDDNLRLTNNVNGYLILLFGQPDLKKFSSTKIEYCQPFMVYLHYRRYLEKAPFEVKSNI